MTIDPHELFKPGETYDENEAQIRLKIRQMVERKKAELDAMEAASAQADTTQPDKSVTELPIYPAAPEAAETKDLIQVIPVALLDDFPKDKHPFRPYTKEQRAALAEDISRNRLIQPLVVRPSPMAEGRFEIISGHNRRDAASDIGYKELPCIVRRLSDDEALIQMLSSNLKQREGLLPSEKAWAYRYQLEAMKRQGRRSDLWEDGTSRQDSAKLGDSTCDQVGHKLKSVEILAEQSADSRNQILRYIRLTYLVPELLDMVDDDKLPFIVGVTLSYLSTAHQTIVHIFFFEQRSYAITQNMAEKLREMENAGTLDEQALEEAFLKASTAVKPLKAVKMPLKKWKSRIDPAATEKEVVDMCECAVDVLLDCRDEYFDKDADAQTVVDAIKEAMEERYGKKRKRVAANKR